MQQTEKWSEKSHTESMSEQSCLALSFILKQYYKFVIAIPVISEVMLKHDEEIMTSSQGRTNIPLIVQQAVNIE